MAILKFLKNQFWPVSSLAFGPWHAPLFLAMFAGMVQGTALGGLIDTHYTAIKSTLVILFSLYFVVAFMIWIVRGKKPVEQSSRKFDPEYRQQVLGLTTKQIIGWGVVGIITVPLMIVLSAITTHQYFIDTYTQMTANADPTVNSGLVWLISISVLVMIPVMVIWLVWMWLAWAKAEYAGADVENWSYDYEY
jgi:hypothetical protein